VGFVDCKNDYIFFLSIAEENP